MTTPQNPIEYLSALPDNLEPQKKREELLILKPLLADLYMRDRASFGVVANLVKEKLGVGRRDLEAGVKPLIDIEGTTDSKPQPIARFPELVNLVEDEGEVKFLVHSGNNGKGPTLEIEWEVEGQLYIPPAKNLIPWLLPQADRVLAVYEVDTSATLYTDLVTYYQSLAELPTDTHYDLLVAFTFHTYRWSLR